MNKLLLRWLPAAILLIGGLAAWALVSSPLSPRRALQATPVPLLPQVEVLELVPRDIQVTVRSQGTVGPRREIDLISEVAGRVVAASPALSAGGFFEAGEVLVELDTQDARLALERAAAAVDRLENEARLEESKLARLRALAQSGIASRSQLEAAEYAARMAQASQREARAARQQARRDLERTRVHAPFAGRVRVRHVDAGQFVTRGTALARIYAVDYAEVRLPIADADLAYLDPDGHGPPVRLSADFAGRSQSWTGHIVRTEAEISLRSRMLHLVARVDDPYGRRGERHREKRPVDPLLVGLFVEAEITGRTFEEVFVLPLSALQGGRGGFRPGGAEVLVLERDRRLHLRRVEVLRIEGEQVVVGGGLRPGEQVCVSASKAAPGTEAQGVPVTSFPRGLAP